MHIQAYLRGVRLCFLSPILAIDLSLSLSLSTLLLFGFFFHPFSLVHPSPPPSLCDWSNKIKSLSVFVEKDWLHVNRKVLFSEKYLLVTKGVNEYMDIIPIYSWKVHSTLKDTLCSKTKTNTQKHVCTNVGFSKACNLSLVVDWAFLLQ